MRSRSSLPALKCGMYLAGILTGSPVLGLRPHAWQTVIEAETTKATNLCPSPFGQRMRQFTQNGVDGQFEVFEGKLGMAQRKLFDEFRSGHGFVEAGSTNWSSRISWKD